MGVCEVLVDDPEDVGVEDREDDEGGCEDDVGGAGSLGNGPSVSAGSSMVASGQQSVGETHPSRTRMSHSIEPTQNRQWPDVL